MRFLTRLKSLQAIEATARHGSFVAAAEELNVTPAAVGQMVRSMEDWIGYPLFKRSRTGIERLTPVEEVQEAIRDIGLGLDNLEAGLNKLAGRRNRSVVVVAASQAFVANWLLRELDAFCTEYPHIDIRLDVSDQGIGLANGEADIGIRCGTPPWPELQATHLMDEEIIAVCHKRLLPEGQVQDNDWILQQTMIVDTTPQPGGDVPNWSDWLAAAGVNSEFESRQMQINSTSAVIQAAISGRGLALVRKAFVYRQVEDGNLIQLFPNHSCPVKWAYYVVATSKALLRMETKAFHDWMVKQTSILSSA